MSSAAEPKRGVRIRSRIMLLLVLSISVFAAGVEGAYAIDAVKPGPQIAQAAESHVTTSTSPFTHISTVGGVSATITVWEPSAGSLVARIEVEGIVAETTAVDNQDGTITYTTTGPEGYTSTETEPHQASGSGTCTDLSCLAVIGATKAVAAVACMFAKGYGCSAAQGAGDVASRAYCDSRGCDSSPACPSHTVHIADAKGTPGTYGRAMAINTGVNCNMNMESITLKWWLYKDGVVVWSEPVMATCYEASGCRGTWTTWGWPAGCYNVYGMFFARWRDKTTNHTTEISGGKWSNTVCLA